VRGRQAGYKGRNYNGFVYKDIVTADTAAKLKRWEFMLAIEPLRVERGAGSLVNPVALF
jgi:hypothetical protein